MKRILFLVAGVAAVTLGAPVYAAEATTRECSAYVYAANGVSLCADHAAGDVDCKRIGAPVSLAGGADPWRLDRDGDGRGCETQTGSAPTPASSPSRTTTEAGTGGTLPLTGPGAPVYVAAGVSLTAAGGALALLLVARRRRLRFRA